MKPRKIIALGLILAGGLALGYPVWLTVQTRMEVHNLRANFTENPVIQPNKAKNTEPEATGAGTAQQWPKVILQIPAINLNVPVVAVKDVSVFATNIEQLPAHYPQTALPGQTGNIAIAGHVNGPAGYFAELHALKQGDTIILATPSQQYQYAVEKVFITDSNDWSVIANTNYQALTLTTCQRVGTNTSAKRLIVRAQRIALATQK